MASIDLPRGAAKKWVRFNGSGTVTINDDLGVGSITDHGTGDYTVNFDTDNFGAADYCYVSMARDTGASALCVGKASTASATSSHRFVTASNSDVPIDAEEICVAYFGDLA